MRTPGAQNQTITNWYAVELEAVVRADGESYGEGCKLQFTSMSLTLPSMTQSLVVIMEPILVYRGHTPEFSFRIEMNSLREIATMETQEIVRINDITVQQLFKSLRAYNQWVISGDTVRNLRAHTRKQGRRLLKKP